MLNTNDFIFLMTDEAYTERDYSHMTVMHIRGKYPMTTQDAENTVLVHFLGLYHIGKR